MTNAQIIFNASVQLMEDGIIKGTGRVFEYEDESGELHRLEEPEALHTFATWKEMGRIVKRGEKCKARIDIWKPGKGKQDEQPDADGDEITASKVRMFKKTAYFFTFEQTEPIKPKTV